MPDDQQWRDRELDGRWRDPNTADVIVAYLEQEGVDTVFGVPGGPIMGLFDSLSRRAHVRTVLCKHEQGAVFAAYGHARGSGRLGVAVVTSGPGSTNALSALASANLDRVPVVLLAGQVGTTFIGRGAAQDSSTFGTDVVAMARPITARSLSVASGKQLLTVLPALLREAHCTQRPVLLQLPADVLSEPIAPGLPRPGSYRMGRSAAFDLHAAERVLPPMSVAGRAAILVGSGARSAEQSQLVQLAEALGAAVVTTPKAKGIFPEDHYLSLGAFGFAGSNWAHEAMLHSELELLLVLGSSMGELATDGWNRRLQPPTLVQVDNDPAAIAASYPASAVVGEVSAVLRYWLSRLPTARRPPPEPRWLRELKRHTPRFCEPGAMASAAVPLRPERIFAELQACLPHDAVLVCDIGNCMAYAIHYLCLRSTQRFVIPLGYACMGHAPATALGMALAQPNRPVIAVVGDAAFAMGGFEVHTAVESLASAQRTLVVLVLNNGGNGMVQAGAHAQFGAGHAIDTGQYRSRFDIAAIARGLGAVPFCVSAPCELESAMAQALELRGGAAVIEVCIASNAVPPMGSRIDTLLHFAAEHAALAPAGEDAP